MVGKVGKLNTIIDNEVWKFDMTILGFFTKLFFAMMFAAGIMGLIAAVSVIAVFLVNEITDGYKKWTRFIVISFIILTFIIYNYF